MHWGRKAVIVSQVNSLFCLMTGGIHLSLKLCLTIKENYSNLLVLKEFHDSLKYSHIGVYGSKELDHSDDRNICISNLLSRSFIC